LPPDHKLAPKWAWPGVRDPMSRFWDSLNISQREKATIFKFGTHIGKHIGLRSALAGAYCGGHLAAQLVIVVVLCFLCFWRDCSPTAERTFTKSSPKDVFALSFVNGSTSGKSVPRKTFLEAQKVHFMSENSDSTVFERRSLNRGGILGKLKELV